MKTRGESEASTNTIIPPRPGLRLVHTTPLPSSSVLTTSKAARYLSMSRSTLLRYTDLGQLRCFDLFGRRVYKIEDLDALIASLKEWRPHQTREGSQENSNQ